MKEQDDITEDEEKKERTSSMNEEREEQSDEEPFMQEIDKEPDHYEKSENWCFSKEDKDESVQSEENAIEKDEFGKQSEKEVTDVTQGDMTEHDADAKENKILYTLINQRRNAWRTVKRYTKLSLMYILVLFISPSCWTRYYRTLARTASSEVPVSALRLKWHRETCE